MKVRGSTSNSWPTSPNSNSVSATGSATKICCVSRSRIRPSPTNKTIPCRTTSGWNFSATQCWDSFSRSEIYEKFPGADEGLLTKSRAKLVNASSLAAHGRALGLGAHLVLSRGEENTGGRERPSALADAFEALLGAVFLDGGFDAAREFILREFAADFSALAWPAGIENPKGELQELLQSRSPTRAGIPTGFRQRRGP